MQQNGHSSELQYISTPGPHKRKARKWNIVWFKPTLQQAYKDQQWQGFSLLSCQTLSSPSLLAQDLQQKWHQNALQLHVQHINYNIQAQ